MIIRVEFINPKLRDFVIIASDPQSKKPAKRVTFPIREVHGIFEHNIDE